MITITTLDPRVPSESAETLATFLHEHLDRYRDSMEDIHRALDYALSSHPCKGGTIYLARKGDALVGMLVMLHMPTAGFVPEHLLVYIAVDASLRGEGVGTQLMQAAIADTDGDIALHVEKDNPAQHLYERMGFSAAYVEMRYKKG